MISQCVILVGGLGTRLGELTRATPKPLLPVNGKPFLDHLIHRAARFGFTDIVLLAGYLGDQVLARYAGPQRIAGRDVQVRVVVEREPAGTGGALRYLDGIADEYFLLMNGDSWFDMDLRAFAGAPLVKPTLAKIALRRLENSGRYGGVILDRDRIVDFAAAGAGNGDSLINAGIYLASRELIGEVRQIPCSLERDIFAPMAKEGRLSGASFEGTFIDIGIADDYARAETVLRDNLHRPAVFFDRDGVLNLDEGYTHKPDALHWNPGAVAAVRAVNAAGWYVFVVTNQAGVGHGHYGEKDVDIFHRHMEAELAREGAHIDEFVYCPFHPDAKLAAYRRDSAYRKPNPGMILDILARWPVDAPRSFLVGDRDSDLKAAAGASIGAYLYSGGDLNALVTGALKERGTGR
ncbi:MAG: HAD-IIIA family hydrolase [Alphaproteobacteria bacterium]|nr:HAD-IIIA family hydrolase [Alphaproteobacteria bacterium]